MMELKRKLDVNMHGKERVKRESERGDGFIAVKLLSNVRGIRT